MPDARPPFSKSVLFLLYQHNVTEPIPDLLTRTYRPTPPTAAQGDDQHSGVISGAPSADHSTERLQALLHAGLDALTREATGAHAEAHSAQAEAQEARAAAAAAAAAAEALRDAAERLDCRAAGLSRELVDGRAEATRAWEALSAEAETLRRDLAEERRRAAALEAEVLRLRSSLAATPASGPGPNLRGLWGYRADAPPHRARTMNGLANVLI
jgi:hypothetical protein